MRAKLVVVGGDTKTSEVNLHLPAILGRGREATLTLPHPLVSRQHCEITEADGQLIVRDLGSLNGTFVANERVNETVLEDGQLLTVGTVTFRAVYLDADESAPEPPQQTDAQATQVPDEVQTDETVPAPDTPNDSEQQSPEQQSPEQKSPEQKSPEQQSPEQQSPEQKSPEQKSPEQKSPEQKSPEGDQQVAPPEPPLAEPVAADDDDDLSQFFESLK